MYQQVLPIVVDAIGIINQNLEQPLALEQLNQCSIYGGAAGLYSISLVALISLIEESVENSLGVAIILANEKALSRKHTPFLNVGVLTSYICELINAEASAL